MLDQESQQKICNIRDNLDKVIKGMRGIHFFLSCVTGTTKKGKRKSDESGAEVVVSPAIAYFIAFTECHECNEDVIFATLHDSGTYPNVKSIRHVQKHEKYKDELLNCLKITVKVCCSHFKLWLSRHPFRIVLSNI